MEHLESLVCDQLESELYSVPIGDDRHLIYAPLKKAAFVGNSALVNLLMDFREGTPSLNGTLPQELYEFLQRLHLMDCPPGRPPDSGPKGDPAPTEVTLFLTTGCNLRCTYCYASAGDSPLKKMSLETAQRGVDFVLDNAIALNRSHVEVGYHGGGEPTTNWPVMAGSFDYAKERASKHGIEVIGSCATNGVLNPNQREWLAANFQGVSVSFDGHPDAQDAHRLTVNGSASSNIVEETLHFFDERSYDYGIRVTVTHDQIGQLSDSVEYICSNFSPSRIQVEPAYQMGRWRDAPSAETARFIEAYRLGRKAARKHGMDISFSAVRPEMLTNHFCSITRDGFSLSTEGEVTSCYESFSRDNEFSDIFFYGDWDSEQDRYQFNLDRLGSLREQTVENREFCRGCFAKWHCAGDCYHKSLSVNGRGKFKGSDRCHIIRELTKDLLMEWIEESGGIYWSEFSNVRTEAI